MNSLATHYLDEIRRQLRGHKRLVEGALAQLKDEDFFVTLDPESNSIAILIKHISGNMRSRFTDFLTTDGEKPDRHRDGEFELSDKTDTRGIDGWWEERLERRFWALDSLTPDDVMRTDLYPAGTAYGCAGAQPGARSLCNAPRSDRVSGEAFPLERVARH